MKLSTLYKRSKTDKINSWTIEVEGNRYRTITGFVGFVETTSEWTVCSAMNSGKKNATTPEEQALAEATALHRKRQEKGYFEDISKCDEKVYFEPMLAQSYSDRKDEITYPIFSQPKLDGIRCVIDKDGMWSRNGKAIVSAPHIYEVLKPLFTADPNLILDGELYCDKLANDFNKICSIVKKTKPKNEDLIESQNVIEYHIYDIPSVKSKFSNRYNFLKELLHNKIFTRRYHIPSHSQIKLVETCSLKNEDEVNKKYEEYIERGYEGQMLRIDADYQNKRSKYLLKHKSFIDEEYTILGVVEGEGNRTGMVGYMEFTNKNGKPFKSNVKANWDELKEMWNNRNELIGKSATIQYFQLTTDGVPRFPYVTKVWRDQYE